MERGEVRLAKLPSFSASAVSGTATASVSAAAVSGTATVAAAVSMVAATDTLPSFVPNPAFPPLLAFLALLPSLATLLLGNRLSVGIFLITSYKNIINKKRGYKNTVTTASVKQYKQAVQTFLHIRKKG
jgi:hypothetical protein